MNFFKNAGMHTNYQATIYRFLLYVKSKSSIDVYMIDVDQNYMNIQYLIYI